LKGVLNTCNYILVYLQQHSDTMFEITLYRTSMFKTVYYRYPMLIPYNARVFAEASIKCM